MSQKTYIPKSNVKERETQFGPVLQLGLHADTLIEFAKKHQNERGYRNLEIQKMRQTDSYGITHAIALKEWSPKEARPASPRGARPERHGGFAPDDTDDVPF